MPDIGRDLVSFSQVFADAGFTSGQIVFMGPSGVLVKDADFTHDPVTKLLTVGGNIAFKSGTSFTGTFDHANSADRTYTLPNATGTLAELELAQTWTAAQTFDALVTINANLSFGSNTGFTRRSTGIGDYLQLASGHGLALMSIPVIADSDNYWLSKFIQTEGDWVFQTGNNAIEASGTAVNRLKITRGTADSTLTVGYGGVTTTNTSLIVDSGNSGATVAQLSLRRNGVLSGNYYHDGSSLNIQQVVSGVPITIFTTLAAIKFSVDGTSTFPIQILSTGDLSIGAKKLATSNLFLIEQDNSTMYLKESGGAFRDLVTRTTRTAFLRAQDNTTVLDLTDGTGAVNANLRTWSNFVATSPTLNVNVSVSDNIRFTGVGIYDVTKTTILADASAGNMILNAPATKGVFFAVNGSYRVTIDATNTTIANSLVIGGQKLKTTNLAFKEGSSDAWYLRNAADNAYTRLIGLSVDMPTIRSQDGIEAITITNITAAMNFNSRTVTNLVASNPSFSGNIGGSPTITGTWTWSGATVIAPDIQVANLKSSDGITAISIANVTGLPTFSQGLVIPTTKHIDIADSQTTVGAAGAASALPANPTGYVKVKIAGTERVIPFYAQA